MNRLQRTAATLALPAVMAAAFVFAAAQSPAHATPNVESVLPADGVLSIERSGDQWTVTTESAPSEVKVMDPTNAPICGVNYADSLGLCTTTTTFTADASCVYIQVDGIVGHNSSDPYVCRPGGIPLPTITPVPLPTATYTPTPSPTPSETSTPTSTPEPSSSPEPSATPSPSSTPTPPSQSASPTLPPVGTDTPRAISKAAQQSSSAPDQLAATGMPKWLGLLVLILVPSLVGLGVWMISRSKAWRLQAPETEEQMTERYWRQGHEDHV